MPVIPSSTRLPQQAGKVTPNGTLNEQEYIRELERRAYHHAKNPMALLQQLSGFLPSYVHSITQLAVVS